MTTTTDDELLSTAQAVLDDPKSVYLNLLNATEPLKAYVNAASPERVKALVMRVREAERDRDDAVETALALEKRLKRAEEALRKIADAPAWGAPDRWETTPTEVRRLAAAYFSNPAGEGE